MSITYDDIKHKLQPPLDCSEIKDLRGRYFYNRLITNYDNTDFSGCVLFHCYPSGIPNALEVNPAQSEDDVSLRGVDLSDANFRKDDFTDAYLQNVDFSEAFDIAEANFSNADLEGSVFTGDLFEEEGTYYTVFENANLSNSDFSESSIDTVDFTNANLSNSNFSGTSFGDVVLEGANFSNADLSHASLSSSMGYGIKKVSFKGAFLLRADLSENYINKCDFSKADLDEVDFSNTTLDNCNLKHATLIDADLRGTVFREGTNLEGADLSDAKYDEETDFSGSNIIQEQLDSMIFVEDED